jgi:hypothetical protein
MVKMPQNATITLPLFTRVGGHADMEIAKQMGFVHLGDVEVEIPLEFSAQPTARPVAQASDPVAPADGAVSLPVGHVSESAVPPGIGDPRAGD